jgi:hypothetical protein
MIWRCAVCGAEPLHNTIRCEQCGKPLVFPVDEPVEEDAMSDTYILNGHQPVPCPDLMWWSWWFATADRHVRDTARDDVRVSTVFLGLDHGFGGRRELFETMLFVNGTDQGVERYSTWDEAEEGHERWVMKVFKATPILALPTSGDVNHG